MIFRRLVPSVFLIVLATASSAAAQDQAGGMTAPTRLQILGVSVEGIADEYTRGFVLQTSGLVVGQQVLVPGAPEFSDAIRAIYRLGTYDDVKIVEERRVGDGVFLLIRVREVAKLTDYAIEGVSKGEQKDLRKELPLLLRAPVRPGALVRSQQIIRDFFAEKGRPLARTEIERTEEDDGLIRLTLKVDKGPKVRVGEIRVEGNEAIDDGDVRGAMKTRKKHWWKFWRSGLYKAKTFDEDLQRIVEHYNEKGYYDAKVVSDSVWLSTDGDKPRMVVRVAVHEGPRYFVRNVSWDGNTVFNDQTLTENLGFRTGDPYNSKRFEQNLYSNPRNTDISSLYYNIGYMRFGVEPRISVVEGDSLDLHFDVFEGDIYRYGTITINGNAKTKEHVVRRELDTIPGQTFSRDGIQESIRRLMQLGYFTQESLAPGPSIDVREETKSVDLEYSLQETGSDQLELSGTWGRYGLILQLRFAFNNFSAQNFFKKDAWKPLPSGDGQRLSLSMQTNGSYYQQYAVSFTEPWFRGRPTPIGFSASFSKLSGSSFFSSLGSRTGDFLTASTNVFYERRLAWPDPLFSMSTGVGFQHFRNDDWISTLPSGVSNQVTFRQSISRNSTNHPLFATSGSRVLLSLEIAPPIGKLIQYHKWRFSSSWNAPLSQKIAVGLTADYGYIGSLSGDPVQFERFVVGGSPFETQGYYSYFGKDIVYMRGYPLAALGPRRDGDPVGGRVLNKYTSELRWVALTGEQLQAAPYLFLDAANTWDGFRSYNPTDLFRSAGFGVRLFLPILGMVEMAYGYNFDAFEPINSRHNGSKRWSFQFSLGQGFGQ